ncbi:MAG: hypothetical protein AVDCRST_MAG42-3300 [uncultured Chthoniobacterales bacterium]|uniref:Uncharacterized protein n=1 Tax=uncultured Chthoniobacterales bacterium TaxID=1836801 RepID=A0A6J4J8K8_9BACT|nr:MAG: hypothetical protein AVDCRST_MAG42-3300 [uncultured Chthoniobacterales bacterium]
MIDVDPGDPLDFSLEGYFDQIVAGHSRNTPNGAQVTAFSDFHDLQRRASAEQAAP